MNPSTIRQGADDVANDHRPTAQVLPLVAPLLRADRRRSPREAVGAAGPFGQILLFTGVRYERILDVQAGSEGEPAILQRRHS